MNSGFARRLELLTALEIAGVLWLLVLGAALFAFGAYVQTVKTDLAATLQQAVVRLDATPGATSASDAATAISNTYMRSGIVVIIFDRSQRIDVYRATRTDSQVTIHDAKHGEPPPFVSDNSLLTRLILGLATAFGLTVLHGHIGVVDLVVRDGDASLVGVVAPFILPFVIALALVTMFGFAFARVLTRQALRPLVEVQAALQRFADGDLRPQIIAADRRSSLGQLAAAYNGAVAQMQRAFDERERANASMRQFIADAGHQLRTPLTVIRGFIAILRKGDLRTPEDRERILETMHRQSALMGSLVDKLMLLDRWEGTPDAATLEPIDVGRLVDDVVAPLAEANAERVVRVSAPSGDLVAIDPIDLSHAVTNIVDNALKYTAGAIDVDVVRTGERVIVTIADAGPGMAPAEVAHAFDRFFRGARRDIDGTGLGLAIAKRAIERAGGTLSLRSSESAGSTFAIELPAAHAPRRAAILAARS